MSALDVQIGLATQRDAHHLAALARDLIEAGLGWEYRPHRIASLIDDADTVTVVARGSMLPIGFAAMRFGDERAHLILLAVQPRHQRHGVGRRLVSWLLESARVAGVTSVHVELRAGNDKAYAFYRSLGFADTFRIHGYYRGRETALRMIRMLAAPALGRS
jgi:ribosomal-protein-alanine N-acetyltransferase